MIRLIIENCFIYEFFHYNYQTVKVHAVVGASLGGMSSLNAAALYPDRVGR